jgi:hypothetical protein
MEWAVIFHKAFEAEFAELPLGVQEELAATRITVTVHLTLLRRANPLFLCAFVSCMLLSVR